MKILKRGTKHIYFECETCGTIFVEFAHKLRLVTQPATDTMYVCKCPRCNNYCYSKYVYHPGMKQLHQK